MLRRQPVIHGHDHRTGIVAQQPTFPVVGFKIADHPATAMKIDDQWVWTLSGRGIDSYRNVSGGTFDAPVPDRRHLRRGAKGSAQRTIPGTSHVGFEFMGCWPAFVGGIQSIDELFCLGIQWQGDLLILQAGLYCLPPASFRQPRLVSRVSSGNCLHPELVAVKRPEGPLGQFNQGGLSLLTCPFYWRTL